MATVSDTLKGFGKPQLALMAAVGILLLGFFAVIAMRVSAPTFTSMYTNLSIEDSAKIVTELEQQNIPYQIRANGSEIAVPSDKMLRMRMSMAEKGLPSTGNVIGYEIFDKSEALGSSQFVMNVNMLRALEGELGRTIGELAQIDSARVHLVVPKRELFSKDKQEPTASVALKLRGNMELEKQQVAAIVNLVAAAVPGLKASKVTVVDSFGRLLAKSEEEGSLGAAVSTTEEYRIAFEGRLKNSLEGLIERTVGPGRVKAQITADINFDRIITNKETFDPEGQVVRSTQSSSENEAAQDTANKDGVTVGNQLPTSAGTGATSQFGGGGQQSKRDNQKVDEVTNYEISKTIQNHTKEGGSINKLSVAILVDGTYSKQEGETVYAARSPEELKKIEQLVKSAIGFNADRGDKIEVVNMRFVTAEDVEIKPTFFEEFRDEMQGIIQTLVIAIVVILVILLVVRPAVMHVIRSTAPATEKLAEGLASMGAAAGNMRLPGGAPIPGGGGFIPSPGMAMGGGMGAANAPEEEEVMVDIGNIKGRVRSTMIRKVTEFVEQNPDESMMVVRQWMSKEA
jgi:flagellar M-ring protein FliF